jgi:hypothetical protein
MHYFFSREKKAAGIVCQSYLVNNESKRVLTVKKATKLELMQKIFQKIEDFQYFNYLSPDLIKNQKFCLKVNKSC